MHASRREGRAGAGLKSLCGPSVQPSLEAPGRHPGRRAPALRSDDPSDRAPRRVLLATDVAAR
jgi:hypothetical protein